MNNPGELIIQFSRAPILGQVKRRLAEQIGDDAALKVHNKLFAKTLQVVSEVHVATRLYLSSPPTKNFPHDYQIQQGNNLGDRMAHALQTELINSKKICLIGSDCLDLTANDLREAFAKLETNDLVLGPARDGGYYLIGLKTFIPELFINVSWGSSTVLEETLSLARKLNLKTGLLDERQDVDRYIDLPENWKAL